MSRIVHVHFRGGPLDPRNFVWTADPPPLPRTMNYSGDVYTLRSHRGDQFNYRFNKEATKLAAPGLAGVAAAWTRLMRALGHTAPKNLARVHRSTVRVRRLTKTHR
jgi:hypothetical protein